MEDSRFLRYDFKKTITIDNVYTSFFSNMSNGHSTNGERHNFHELVYIDNGAIYTEVGTGVERHTVLLPKGYAYLHAPDCWHRHFAPQNGTGNMCIVSFRCENMELRGIEEKRFALTQRQQEYFREVMRCATRMFKQIIMGDNSFTFVKQTAYNPAIEQLFQNNLEILVLDIYMQQKNEAHETVEAVNSKDSLQLAEQIKIFLKQKVYDHINIEDICQRFSYSKATLSNWFKNYTGWSIISYFNRLKVEEAIRLLEEGTLTITDIARELNFSSGPYFSRVFKEHVGMYPRDFKKSALNKAELEQIQTLTLENESQRKLLLQGNGQKWIIQ